MEEASSQKKHYGPFFTFKLSYLFYVMLFILGLYENYISYLIYFINLKLIMFFFLIFTKFVLYFLVSKYFNLLLVTIILKSRLIEGLI